MPQSADSKTAAATIPSSLPSSAAGSTCFPARLSIYHLRLQLGPSRVQQRQRQRLLVPVLLPARRFFALPDYPRSSQLQQQ